MVGSGKQRRLRSSVLSAVFLPVFLLSSVGAHEPWSVNSQGSLEASSLTSREGPSDLVTISLDVATSLDGKRVLRWVLNPEGEKRDFSVEISSAGILEVFRVEAQELIVPDHYTKRSFLVKVIFTNQNVGVAASRVRNPVEGNRHKNRELFAG